MQPLYGQDGTTIIGYSYTNGYAIWTYNTSWQAQGITLDAAAISSGTLSPVLTNSVTTGYTYTDTFGTLYTYNVDPSGAVTGYTSTYSGLGYSYTYNFDALGAFNGYSHFDGTTTTTYDKNWTVVSTVTVVASNMVAILDAGGATIGYSVTDEWGTATNYALDQVTVTGYSYTYVDTVNNTTSVSTYDANWNYIGSETRDALNNLLYSNSYSYDANGAFTGYTYFDGVTTTVYDANWNVVSSTASTANLTSDGAGGFYSTDAWGTTTTYDSIGQVTGYRYSYTNWDNSVSVTTYDASWNYIGSETRDAQNNLLYSNAYTYVNGVFSGYTYFDGVTTTVYDANWNVISSTANIASLTQILDANNQLIGYSKTDEWGTTTTYDTAGALTGYSYRYTNWDNSISVTTYDANWNYLSSETRDAQNNLLYSSSYSYDANGNFAGYTYFDGVTTTVYDANWNVVSSTASTANLTSDGAGGFYSTDAWGTTTTYDSIGQVTGYRYSYTDSWNNTTSVTTYDASWNYIGSETRDAQNNLLYSNTYSYVNGVFSGYTYFDGVTTTVYDANWNVVSSTASTANMTPIVDGLGQTVGYSHTDAYGTTTTYDTTGVVTGYSYRYTNWDNSVSVTTYDANWTYIGSETRDAQDKLLYSNIYSYDANGAFTGYTYFDGVTTTVYDANWNVVSSTASTAGMTQLLDANSQLIGYSHTDQWGTTTTYDLNGQVTGYRYSYTNWDNSVSVTTYDASWNYIGSETRDAQNNLLYSNSYSYDANGAFTGYTYFDGVTTTVYDANWNVVSSTVSTAGMTQLLDANSQLIGYSHTDQWGTTTTYDLSGFVTSYRYSSVDSAHNTTTVTTYDKNWYFISSVTNDNTSGAELYRSEYSYDTAGAFAGYTYFDGITTTVYDAGWNVVSSTVSTANMIQVFDANNQLTGYRFTDAWGTTTYYDTNNVKTGSVYTYVDTWNNTTTVTTYGANGNYLSSETKNTTTGTVLSSSSYSYDQAGNFTGYTSFDGVTTTVYNSNWQVVSSTTSIANLTEVRDAGNVLTGYTYTDVWGTTTYYDLQGAKTGSSYSYTNWDGTKSVSHYDKNGSYTGWSNTDAQGNVLSSSLYNYDQQGNYAGYTYFDGVITTVYDAAGAVIGTPTVDLTRLTLNTAQDGYYRTDASGTTTYYDLQGAKTGSSYSYANWDGTNSVSHYDASGSYIGWSNTDAQGNVLSSSLYNYDLMGAYIGYTSFDGFTTTVYDSFGMFVSSSIDLTKLTLNAAQDGYYRTDASGTTTYYDLQGAKTGSSYSYANWDGTKSISHYDANGSYIGWSNTDAQGKVLSSSLYNYDQFGNYLGYTSFDGITTTVYDANWNVLSATANTANLTQVLDASNVLIGYSHTDTYGTTTYYDTLGVKTGSSYSYTYADGTKSLSHYDASGSYIGWSNTDALGKVLSSSMYNYDQQGNYIGYTSFDGITTTVYDANWNVLSATANTANMTQVLDASNVLIGYSHTDAYGTTTYYDTSGAKTGSSSSYTNWDGTISHSHYNVSGSYIGWSNTDAQGKVLSSSMYNYDQFGSYAGYTSFDGVTTTVYDASGYVLSSTANTANLTQVLDANNSLIGYSHIDTYGTTTYYDLQGVKTGSSYTYTNWDGTKSISHYNATGSYIGWSNTDTQGNVLNSSMNDYDQQGNYIGYTYFDGITTTVYDAFGVVQNSTVNTAGMTPLDANGNVLVDANHDGLDDNTSTAVAGYRHTDAYGTTSTYDLSGIKTGYSYTYYDSWNNTTYVSTYKADGTFLKSVSTAANGTVLYSEEYLYNPDGTPAGRTVFDGVNTFTWDANGTLLTDVGPYPISMALTGNGMTMDLSEVAYLPTDPITTLAFTMLKNGVTAMNINGFTGDGTASMAITTDQTLAAGDWVLMNYTGSTVANGIRDVAGNVMLNNAQPGYGGSAEGSTGDNVINLSNTTVFSATGGYDISGGLGNDTITGSAAFDWIMGGAGADTLTGGTTGDHFSFVQDGSSLVSYTGFAYAAANGVDRITDFSVGDGLSMNVADSFAPGSQPQGLSMMSMVPTNGLAADQSYFLAQGNYSAGQFTVNATTGTDTMVVYDSDATTGVSQSGVVLSGVTVGQLGTMAGSSYVSYMGGSVTPPPPPPTGSAVTLLVSSDTNGLIGNALSTAYGLSADGRFVLFESDASNLVLGDTNAMLDLFVKDTQTGATVRVSTDASGAQSSGFFFASDISADGRYVAMASDVNNLVTGDTDGLTNVFIKDTQTNAITQVDTDVSGVSAVVGILGSDVTDTSADGRYVVIGSDAANLVANDNNNTFDLFLKDTQTNAITRVNTDVNGTEVAHTAGADNYLGGFVSDDGRYVVFESDANNLVAGDTNGVMDIFKKDIQTGAITQVNTDANGAAATGGAGYIDDFTTWNLANEIADISADGRYVLFVSAATNLVTGDTNGVKDVFIKDTQTGAIERVSTDANGLEANGASQSPFHSLSSDGRYAIFHSGASNLVAGDTNNLQDIFVKDIWTGAIARVNLDASGGQAVGGGSNKERISDDGSTIVFRTGATNLVANDTNGVQDVVAVANPFMTNTTGGTILVSGDSATGLIANAFSKSKSVSGDGRYVVFESDATNLVANDTNGLTDVFMKDTQTGAITLVSTNASGVQATGGVWGNYGADVSDNGRYVLMVSDSTNLVTGDTNGLDDVFIKDIVAGTVARVSTNAAGQEATGGVLGSDTTDISADGRYVVMGSDATNLVAGDTNGAWDIFLKDTSNGVVTRVNTAADGAQANAGGDYQGGKVTDDGQYVVFASNASNLVANDTNGVTDIFKKNIATGAITRITTDAAGTEANSGGLVEDFAMGIQVNNIAGISSDGRYVAFQSSANNLVANDTNGVADIFLKDTQTGAISRMNTNAVGAEAIGGASVSNRALSADGRYLVFQSGASNLVANDTNMAQDVFIKDTQTGVIARLNLDATGGEAVGGNSGGARISADGSTISFNTNATNLVAGHVVGVQDVVAVANPFMTDTLAPDAVDAWADPTINKFGVVFSESIKLNNQSLAGVTAYKNASTQMTLTGAMIDPAFPAELAMTYSDSLVAGDFIVLAYDAAVAGNNITDLAGNATLSGVLVTSVGLGGGTVGATVDASTFNLPAGITSVLMRGNAGVDVFTGTNGNDTIITGRGADIIRAGEGADSIDLFESNAVGPAPARDTVVVGMWDSQRGQADWVTGFDVSSTDAALHDVLGLSSNAIAANVAKTNGTAVTGIFAHSIAGGIVTFYDQSNATVAINGNNRGFANDYLELNLTAMGATVAYQGDTDNNSTVDTLHVFQNNSTALTNNGPTVIHLNGVVGATLGTAAGANVVQVVDAVGPEVLAVSIAGPNSVVFEYSENVTFNLQATHGGMFLNGAGNDIASGASAVGNIITISTSSAIGATDWLMMTTAADVADLSGNVLVPGTTAAIGADGNNTINLSAGVANSMSLYIDGYGGNDTLIGSAGSEDIRGGEGSDIITGGGSQDYIWLDEMLAATDTVVINVGDSTPAGGASDLVYNFDVTSSLTVGNTNDMLDLPSNTIASNTTGVSGITNLNTGSILSHSITNGMISFDDASTFTSALVVGDMTNWGQVKNYMMANIANGETVATYIDMNGNGLYFDAADRLAVFQGNATMDVQVQLYDTMGVVTGLSNTALMNSVTII